MWGYVALYIQNVYKKKTFFLFLLFYYTDRFKNTSLNVFRVSPRLKMVVELPPRPHLGNYFSDVLQRQ